MIDSKGTFRAIDFYQFLYIYIKLIPSLNESIIIKKLKLLNLDITENELKQVVEKYQNSNKRMS